MELDVCQQILEKWSNIKFHEHLRVFIRSQVVPCGQVGGQTDRHDEANGLFWKSLRTRQKRSVKFVLGNICCLFWDPYKTHKGNVSNI